MDDDRSTRRQRLPTPPYTAIATATTTIATSAATTTATAPAPTPATATDGWVVPPAQPPHSNRATPFRGHNSTSAAAAARERQGQESLPVPMASKASGAWPAPFLLYDIASSLPSDHAASPDPDPIYSSSMEASFGRLSSSARAPVRVVINGLPRDTSEQSLRLMVVWSQELVSAELLESKDRNFSSAMLEFKTMRGAREAQQMLHGRDNITNETKMEVNILPSGSPPTGPRHSATELSPKTSSSTSPVANPTVDSRYHLDPSFTATGNSASTNKYAANESMPFPFNGHMPPPTTSGTPYQSFAPAPLLAGNHIQDQPRVSGKHLIEANYTDDDDTSALISNPRAYAENGAPTGRRATAPQIPTARMSGLTLNTNAALQTSSAPSPSHFRHPMSAHVNHMSPINGFAGRGYRPNNQQHRSSRIPAVNPADQNPPCNTLYVGNLPMDANEEELKQVFSKQRGYKRLCFRNKNNGPMCFVEFEDITSATKTLDELYGVTLHNSGSKGGIRLSFSKNPLGVRTGPAPGAAHPGVIGHGVPNGASIGFTSANGPPPGLAAPPGLPSNRSNYNAAALNGNYLYNQGLFSGGSNYSWNNPASNYGSLNHTNGSSRNNHGISNGTNHLNGPFHNYAMTNGTHNGALGNPHGANGVNGVNDTQGHINGTQGHITPNGTNI